MTSNSNQSLTHLDADGKARMVNVSDKQITKRCATASAVCRMSHSAAQAIQRNQIAKGDALQVAKIAAIGAAKRTDELIPLCHSLGLDGIEVQFEWLDDQTLKVLVQTQATARTGVEMEAMVAASVAALTVYDMCKAIDREMVISNVLLEAKSGGVRGDYERTLIPEN